MTKKAYIDLEFKSSISGYEDVEKKLDRILSKMSELSESSGDLSISSGKTTKDKSSSENKSTSKFTKMLVKLGGAAGSIALFTKLITSVVKQSQVYASIVQLVFHPFIVMVNFMLLPVLKWLVPVVSDWLKWTVENREGLEAVGDAFTYLLESAQKFGGLDTNPAKTLIEELTRLAGIDPNEDAWTIFAEQLRSSANITASVFEPLLTLFKMGWVTDVFKAITDSFANAIVAAVDADGNLIDNLKSGFLTFFEDISSALKNVFLDWVGSIPLIGESIRDVLTTPPAEPGGRLGITASDLSSGINIPSTGLSASNMNLEFLLLNTDMTPDNTSTLNNSVSSILRARMYGRGNL